MQDFPNQSNRVSPTFDLGKLRIDEDIQKDYTLLVECGGIETHKIERGGCKLSKGEGNPYPNILKKLRPITRSFFRL
jgi:hypothetical protein